MAPVAVITGASRGLGLALAQELSRRGWALVLDARGAQALAEARATFANQSHVIAIAGDVADAAHHQELANAARELGGIDLLVHNASTLGPSPRPNLLDFPIDALETAFRVNVAAPLALTQALWPQLKPKAKIVAISSDAAVEPYAGWGGYGASKAALEHMFAVLAAEHPERRIYWVDPGDMRTQMHQEAFPGEDISDRPLPEASIPGLVRLIEGDMPSGRYQARALPANDEPLVRELRVALTVNDFEQAARFYQEGLGLQSVESWDRPDGRGLILAAGEQLLNCSTKSKPWRSTGSRLERAFQGQCGWCSVSRMSSRPRLPYSMLERSRSVRLLKHRGATATPACARQKACKSRCSKRRRRLKRWLHDRASA